MNEKLITTGALDRYLARQLQAITAKGYIHATVNNLVNYYLQTETYTKTEVDSMVAAIKQFTYGEVQTLPETPSEETMFKIFLVPARNEENQNKKQEYITVRNGNEGAYTYSWEKIGDTEIDLSGLATTTALSIALANYTTTANLTTLLAGKQDKIDDQHKLNADYVENGTDKKVYTATEKTKLSEIATEAQANKIESLKLDEGPLDGGNDVDIVAKQGKLIVANDNDITELFSPNRLLFSSELSSNDVALVYKDNTQGGLKFLPVEKIGQITVNSERFTLKPYVRFHRGKNGKNVYMHKSETTSIFAEWNRYRLYCDTTQAGGFHWAVTINGTAKSGDVTWQAGATLESILQQMTPNAVSAYLVFSITSGEEFIRVRKGGYSYSIFTLTNNTGATLEDLSFYTRFSGEQLAETHRDWQTQDINTLFPGKGFLPANTKQYARNGLNLSYRCGCNLARYKAYYEVSGSGHGGVDTYLAESAVSGRMSRIGFESLNGDGTSEHQQLYDKYNGSWDAYMEASMIKLDDTHTDGIEYQSYDNGDVQTTLLDAVTTMDFDGQYIHAYPAAHSVTTVTDEDLGRCNMSTNHELGVFMSDETMSKINTAFGQISGATTLSNARDYWSGSPYNGNNIWFYNGTIGCLNHSIKYNGCRVRRLAYDI